MITTNSRKEMIPAPVREVHKSSAFCKPEWDLLCRIRERVARAYDLKRARDMRLQLLAIITDMAETFDDWPEDPK